MKNVISSDSIRNPKVIIDPAMSRYKDIVICPEKVEKAKKTFERLGLPDFKKLK